MPVPAKRRSRSKLRRNRSHQALKKIKLAKCPKCGEAIRPHTACINCGTYKGKTAFKPKSSVKNKKK